MQDRRLAGRLLGLEVAGDIVPSIVTAVFGAAIFISIMRMFARAA